MPTAPATATNKQTNRGNPVTRSEEKIQLTSRSGSSRGASCFVSFFTAPRQHLHVSPPATTGHPPCSPAGKEEGGETLQLIERWLPFSINPCFFSLRSLFPLILSLFRFRAPIYAGASKVVCLEELGLLALFKISRFRPLSRTFHFFFWVWFMLSFKLSSFLKVLWSQSVNFI